MLREDYVPEERLNALIARADVCVSLRAPTMGETSGVALRALSLGRPLVVSDLGWFAELPDEVALKVPVDEHEAETLAAELALLAAEPRGGPRWPRPRAATPRPSTRSTTSPTSTPPRSRRRRRAGRARAGRSARSPRAAADVGIEADDPLAAEIAERLREVRVAE